MWDSTVWRTSKINAKVVNTDLSVPNIEMIDEIDLAELIGTYDTKTSGAISSGIKTFNSELKDFEQKQGKLEEQKETYKINSKALAENEKILAELKDVYNNDLQEFEIKRNELNRLKSEGENHDGKKLERGKMDVKPLKSDADKESEHTDQKPKNPEKPKYKDFTF